MLAPTSQACHQHPSSTFKRCHQSGLYSENISLEAGIHGPPDILIMSHDYALFYTFHHESFMNCS